MSTTNRFRGYEPGRNPLSRHRPVRGFRPWEPGLGELTLQQEGLVDAQVAKYDTYVATGRDVNGMVLTPVSNDGSSGHVWPRFQYAVTTRGLPNTREGFRQFLRDLIDADNAAQALQAQQTPLAQPLSITAAFPPGLELVEAGGSHSFTVPSVATLTFVGWRSTHFQPGLQTGGQYGPWQALPAPWTVRAEGLAPLLTRRVPDGFLGYRPLLAEPAAQSIVPPGYETLHTPRPAGWDSADAIMANERAMTSWMQGQVSGWIPPASWGGSIGSVTAPPSIPFVPGSQIFVPVPGGSEEPTIIPPGSTTPIPISQYRPPITQAPIPSGVPPVETTDGRLVAPPTLTVMNGAAFRPDDVTTEPPSARTPADAVPAVGFVGLALVGIGVLWALFKRRKG